MVIQNVLKSDTSYFDWFHIACLIGYVPKVLTYTSEMFEYNRWKFGISATFQRMRIHVYTHTHLVTVNEHTSLEHHAPPGGVYSTSFTIWRCQLMEKARWRCLVHASRPLAASILRRTSPGGDYLRRTPPGGVLSVPHATWRCLLLETGCHLTVSRWNPHATWRRLLMEVGRHVAMSTDGNRTPPSGVYRWTPDATYRCEVLSMNVGARL